MWRHKWIERFPTDKNEPKSKILIKLLKSRHHAIWVRFANKKKMKISKIVLEPTAKGSRLSLYCLRGEEKKLLSTTDENVTEKYFWAVPKTKFCTDHKTRRSIRLKGDGRWFGNLSIVDLFVVRRKREKPFAVYAFYGIHLNCYFFNSNRVEYSPPVGFLVPAANTRRRRPRRRDRFAAAALRWCGPAPWSPVVVDDPTARHVVVGAQECVCVCVCFRTEIRKRESQGAEG